MKFIVCFTVLCHLVTLASAGVVGTAPLTLQQSFDYFSWINGLINHGGGGSQTPTQGNYNDKDMVTECPPNIVFLLDGSDSISLKGFEFAKEVLIRELRNVTSTFANADVGVVLFSDVTQELALKSRTPAEIEQLVTEVQNLQQPRRKTTLSVAIKRARQLLLDYSVIESRALNGDRSGNIIVLVSDGKADSLRATQQEAKIAKDRRIFVVSLSVEDANIHLLRDISNQVMDPRTPIVWKSIVACPGEILPPVIRGSTCRDFIVVTDGSDSVLQHENTVRQFLAYTSLRFRYVLNAIGVNVYGTDSFVQAKDTRIRLMEDKFTLSDIIRLNLIFPTSGGTGTDQAVIQSVGLLDDDLRDNPASLILITDGPPLDAVATRQAVRTARARGYEVVIIRVGTVLTDSVLDIISDGDSSNVYSVESFADLFSVPIERNICGGQTCGVNSNTCASPFIFDVQRCACVCPTNCGPLKTHDANCNCRCTDSCPGGTVQDDNTCACRCPTTCGAGFIQQSDCSCRRQCPNICANGQVTDNQCQCQCTNTCPTDQRLANDCSCVCESTGLPPNPTCVQDRTCLLVPSDCPSPQVANTDPNVCRCECPQVCPDDARQLSDCSCQCINTGFVFNTQTRQCDRICTQSCPFNAAQQPDCSCQCPNGFTFNVFTRQCDRICSQSCPGNAVQQSDCSCQCPSGFTFNTATRQCVCSQSCPGNAVQQADCSCVCQNGLNFNQVSRQCVCSQSCPSTADQLADCSCQCPSGFNFNIFTRQCDQVCPQNCPNNAVQRSDCSCQCPSGLTFNTVTRQCVQVCSLSCPGNAVQQSDCSCQCPSAFTFNTATRQCVCSQICPSDAIQQSDCSCVCQNGLSFNQVSRRCVCPQSCPGNAVQQSDCSCQCPSGFTFNTATRQCVCSQICPSDAIQQSDCSCVCQNGLSFNQVSRQCVCPQRCPGNAVQQSDCSCQCPIGFTFNTATRQCVCSQSCPGNAVQQADCSCVCQNGLNFNQVSRQCVCSQSCPSTAVQLADCSCQCPSGFNFNIFTRQCDQVCPQNCPNNAVQRSDCSCQCPSGLTFNTVTRQCVQVCSLSCPGNAVQQSDCSCQCPSAFTFNTATRQCVCSQICPSDAIQQSDCSCVCQNGLSFNQVSRRCVCPQSCPGNAVQQSDCSCQCPSGFTFNTATRQCVCSQICPSDAIQQSDCSCVCQNGLSFNQVSRQCVCPQSCPGNAVQQSDCSCQCPIGFTFNTATRQCVCSQICPSDAIQQSDCSCVCQNGLSFNQVSRQCVCPQSCPGNAVQQSDCSCQCPSGFTFNTATRQCVCSQICPSDAIQQSDCSCVCQNGLSFNQVSRQCIQVCSQRCPGNAVQQPDCSCQCPSGFTFNTATRQCVCSQSCPSNADQQADCSCVCQNGLNFNQVSRQCVLVCPQSCPSNAVQLSDCSCQCPVGFTFSTVTRQCVCPCPMPCPSLAIQRADCSCQCPDGLRFEYYTRRCEPDACSLRCPINAVQQSDCSCLCPQGFVFNAATRQCHNTTGSTPFQNEICPPSEQTCDNNQVAYRDCNGRCVCVCSQGFAGARCEISVTPELCDDCIYSNGHYQAGVLGYCNLYVNCVPREGSGTTGSRPSSFTPFIMNCPAGTAYITRPDGWRGCDFLSNGVCEQDQCQSLSPGSKYEDVSACQRYWLCGNGGQIISNECCPSGQAFNPDSGECEPDASCPDTCGPDSSSSCNIIDDHDCPFDVNPLDPSEFFYKVQPESKLRCNLDMVMNLELCTCVDPPQSRPLECVPSVDLDFEGPVPNNDEDSVSRVDLPGIGRVGNFRGDDDIIFKNFAGSGFYTDYFQINLRVRLNAPIIGNSRVAIITNADCNVTESVSVTADSQNMYFTIYQLDSNEPAVIVIPYQGLAGANGWYDISLVYRKVSPGVYEFTATVGGQSITYSGNVELTRVIDRRTCALHLGYGFKYIGIVGYFDDVQVWRCDPNSVPGP